MGTQCEAVHCLVNISLLSQMSGSHHQHRREAAIVREIPIKLGKIFQFVFIIHLISSLEAGAGRADRRRSQSVPRDGRSTTHKESHSYCQVLFL